MVGNGACFSGLAGDIVFSSYSSELTALFLLGPIDAQYLDKDGETEFGRISDVALWA